MNKYKSIPRARKQQLKYAVQAWIMVHFFPKKRQRHFCVDENMFAWNIAWWSVCMRAMGLKCPNECVHVYVSGER